jgi:hypothetical protein
MVTPKRLFLNFKLILKNNLIHLLVHREQIPVNSAMAVTADLYLLFKPGCSKITIVVNDCPNSLSALIDTVGA